MRKSIGRYGAELVVLLAFAVSRVLYYWAGLRFNASPLETAWQLIDVRLMHTDLLRSLFYLHMQPPGFNLMVGLIVKLFPQSYTGVFQMLYLAFGIVAALLMLHLMKLFGVPAWLRAVLTILFFVNPGCVLYENFLLYEYPMLPLLLGAAIALFRLCQTRSLGWSLTFFTLLFALLMIRNQFHLLHLVIIAAALAFVPGLKRAAIAGALPAIAATVALYLKNWILFGAFTSSTWMGMVTGVVTTAQMSPQEIDRLIAQGVVTPIARVPAFSFLNAYSPYVQMPPKRGIPVLDEPVTSTGHPNFNAVGYLQVHRQFLENSKAILRHYPVAYVRSMMIAWFAYFLPASDLHSFDTTRPLLQPFDRIFNAVMFGQFEQAASRKDLRALKASGQGIGLVFYTGTFLMVVLPIVFVWSCLQLVLRLRRRRWSREQLVVLAFMLFTIATVTAISNLLSSFENNRYRFPVDVYYTVLLGMLITSVLQRRALAEMR